MLQLKNANARILELEANNMKLSDEKVAIEHAQTIIKQLDLVRQPPSSRVKFALKQLRTLRFLYACIDIR
jgi:hypothetical protein